jgi:hypothetical protein
MSAQLRELLLAENDADAERRALALLPGHLRQDGDAAAAWARWEAAHAALQEAVAAARCGVTS